MRVCFITNLYPPHARGGAERVVEEEVRALKRLGHDVSVITAAPLGAGGERGPWTSEEDGIRVHRFYPPNLFFYGDIGAHAAPARAMWHLWDAWNASSADVVRRLLLQERPDVVHTHTLKGIGWSVPSVIRSLRIRHVHTLHDVQLAVPSGLLLKGRERGTEAVGLVARFFAARARAAHGSPDVVISPSKFLLDFYEQRGFFPQAQHVWLPNPAPVVPPAPHRPSVETRFLFLGQVETHKGILLLIEAFRRLLKERPKARLDVVGAGARLDDAMRTAGKELRIAFYGRMQPSKFRELFSAADYTAVPSICYENAPTVITESFAHGVPVIVSEIGGAAELVREGENGLTCAPDDVASLLAALRRACDEKGAWPERSRAAKRTAEALDATRHAERLYGLYAGTDHALEHALPTAPARLTSSRT